MTRRRPHPGGPEVGVLRALEARLGRPVALVWTTNRSVYLSLRPRGRGWALRVHGAFREAPEPVWSSLGEYLATGCRAALAPARAHFDRHRAAQPARPAPPLRAAGTAHDLAQALAEACRHGPFTGLPPVVVGWGRRTRPGRRTLRLGSYRAGSPGVIRIHPLLDRPEVPFWAVCQVVHHELVHHYRHWVEGAAEGRRHDRRFRALEAGFPDLDRAREWQARGLGSLAARWGRRRVAR